MSGDERGTQEDLLLYYERVSGRILRTQADLDRFLDCAQEVRPQWLHVNRPPRGMALAKQIVLALLFAFASLQYFVLDVVTEIAALRENVYMAPARLPSTRG